jgi:hypothetical protein
MKEDPSAREEFRIDRPEQEQHHDRMHKHGHAGVGARRQPKVRNDRVDPGLIE